MNNDNHVQEHDTVAIELEAMRQIARALDTLTCTESRERVIRWACDRFQTAAVAKAATAPVAATQTAADAMLGVEDLAEFFPASPIDREALEVPGADPVVAAAVPAPAPRLGVESMLKEFAADFRRFALEWQGA
jgi:hypothetical protein